MATIEIEHIKYEVVGAGVEFNARKGKWFAPAHPKGITTAYALKKGLIKKASEETLFDRKGGKKDTDTVREPPPPAFGTRHFIQLDRGNLHTAYAYGLLYPVALEDRQIVRETTRTHDLQSACPEYLVISQGFSQDAEDTHVLAEVILTPAERDTLVPVGEMSLLPTPLPVSRVTTIWTLTEKIAKSVVASGKTFSDALMPNDILQTAPEELVAKAAVPDFATIPPNPRLNDLRPCKENYDRALGMLAFMRNTDRYFTSTARFYSDLSKNYLPTVATFAPFKQIPTFDPDQKKAATFYQEFVTLRSADTFFAALARASRRVGVFDRQQTTEVLAAFATTADPALAATARQAFDELFDDGFRECLRILSEKPKLSNLMFPAFLYKFRSKEGNDKLTVKQQFPQIVSDAKKAEIILAVLGSYYGYAALPKDEDIADITPEITAIIGASHLIKFSMASALDRATVEAVFHLTFHPGSPQRTMEEILSDLNVEVPPETPLPKVASRLRDESSSVLGTLVRRYRLADEKTDIISLVRQTYQKGRSKLHYLAAYIFKRFPGCVGLRTHPRKSGEFDVDVEDFIKDYEKSDTTDAEEIRDCVEMDRKHSTSKGSR